MKEQIEEKVCKNCIHYQMCVDTFRKAKQDGEILFLEEDAYFAKADGCDFYADKRIYRKQSVGEWDLKGKFKSVYPLPLMNLDIECSACGYNPTKYSEDYKRYNYCPNCGAKMKGGAE